MPHWWTEGRSSTAVAEDLRPTATATVAEVRGHSKFNLNYKIKFQHLHLLSGVYS